MHVFFYCFQLVGAFVLISLLDLDTVKMSVILTLSRIGLMRKSPPSDRENGKECGMELFRKILTFRKMVSPVVLQLLFWAGVGGTLYGTYILIELKNWAWIFAITFGPLVVRVLFERAILAFRTFDRLGDIHDELARLNEKVS